jgi:hypothetical protein
MHSDAERARYERIGRLASWVEETHPIGDEIVDRAWQIVRAERARRGIQRRPERCLLMRQVIKAHFGRVAALYDEAATEDHS